MDRLTEMEAFTRVVEHGAFTDAARTMGLSKSAVSKHVSSLEGRLGVKLLTRTTRRVAPTEIGLRYYERARRVLSDAEEADAIASVAHTAPAGLLRVGVERDFGVHALSPVLGGFLARHENVTLEITLTDEIVEPVAEAMDMAIFLGPAAPGRLRADTIAEAALRMVAAPAYLHRAGRPARLEDLARHALLHRGGKGRTEAVWRITAPSGEVRTVRGTGALTAPDGRFLLNASIAGLGITHLPDYLCHGALQAGLVEEVLPDLPARAQPVTAAYRADDAIRPALCAFLAFLKESFDSHMSDTDALLA